MSKLANKLPFFIQSIVYIMMGIILLLKSKDALTLISKIGAILLILVGVINVIRSLAKKDTLGSFVFPGGILCIIIGAFLFYKPNTISDILGIVLSFGIILSGIFKLQNAIEIARAKAQGWWVFLIISILILAYGIVMLFNPFKTIELLIKFLGVGFIVSGIIDFFSNAVIAVKL